MGRLKDTIVFDGFFYPVVQGADTELRLGNAVLLLTRLPVSEEELTAFIAGPSAAKSGKEEPAVPN